MRLSIGRQKGHVNCGRSIAQPTLSFLAINAYNLPGQFRGKLGGAGFIAA